MYLGHVEGVASTAHWWLLALVLAAALLALENAAVAGGARQAARTFVRLASVALGGALLVASGLAAPVTALGQGAPALPDLISDPPVVSFTKVVTDGEGEQRLVVTFDGYIHNIGDGPLDVVGNPQEPDGMVQRVRNGAGWEEVARPTVRFEVDDGHNHFHLMEAVDYFLWDGRRSELTEWGSKVGFCLVDSEQVTPRADQSYSEELDDFCQENNPDATELRMGISAGWRDVYDATTTLQWVDISEVPPGQYWLAAVTDANNEIVESNEDNNDAVFSERPIVVPGWTARPGVVVADGPVATIELGADAWGTVGRPLWTMVDAPDSGWSSVAEGASFSGGVIRWRPEPGFVGTETLTFSVRDASSPWPLEASTATVTIEVGDGVATADGAGTGGAVPAPTAQMQSTFFEPVVGERFSTFVTASTDGPVERVSHAGRGLPPGLTVDAATGEVRGTPLRAGIFEAEMVVRDDAGEAVVPVTWIVESPGTDGGLRAMGSIQSAALERIQLRVGPQTLGSSYSAIGLPTGIEMDPVSPLLRGTPTETGTFEVAVTRVDPNGDTTTEAFIWTIRPAPVATFPL